MNIQPRRSHYLVVCLLWAFAMFSPAAFSITEQVRVSHDNDDAEERVSDGVMYRPSTDLEFGHDSYVKGTQIVGMRFLSVNIPQGATINSAYIELTVDEKHSGTTNLVISGQDSDNTARFKKDRSNITKREKTSATVDWAPEPWTRIHSTLKTPDITSIIQEIVNRSGWVANNSLVLMVSPGAGCVNANCRRTAESYKGRPNSAPLLVVDYSLGPNLGNQCRATFPDGLNNSNTDGKIKFEKKAQLLNNPDTFLATKKVDNKKNSVKTCVSNNCSASGSIVPTLNRSYIASKQKHKLELKGATKVLTQADHNDYEEVKVLNDNNKRSTLTMSANVPSYHIKKLIIEDSSVELTAGDYYIEELEMKKASELIVIGSGTARIYVKKEAKFAESSVINGGKNGDPAKLVLYSFGDKITFEKDATFAGYIYSEKKVDLKDDSKIFGAITAKGEINLKDDSAVTYKDALDNTDFGDMCRSSNTIDHYQIIHDGQGLTCEAEEVTIKACTNRYDGTCTLSSEDITLDVTATGPSSRSSTDTVNLVAGIGTANIAYTFADPTTLSLSSAGANSTVCVNGSSTTCDLVFSNAGFRFLSGALNGTSIPNQIAGIEFPNALKIQAVENTNGVCTGLFINTISFYVCSFQAV